jgi:predicted aconitase
VELTREELSMLRGEGGEAVREAIALQIEVGEFFGARRFVPIANAHMMGDFEVMGDGGLAWLERLAARGARCAVDVTTNARCVDFAWVEVLGQNAAEAEKEHRLIGLLRSMGVATVDTCINYQTTYEPRFGERLAWGDTGTVIYANSVRGARSNFEAGPAALAAALTARVPEYGFHLDEHRLGSFVVDVRADLVDLADWGALGRLVGERRPGYFQVPVFEGISRAVTDDELKHLGTSLASFGSMAMFHVVGVTPEAPSLEAACRLGARHDVVTVTRSDIDDVYAGYGTEPTECELVVFSAPQLSLSEVQSLSERFARSGASCAADVFVTTEASTLESARRLGYVRVLEEAGVTVMAGVCFYILLNLSELRRRHRWHTLATNSAKLTNVIGAHGFRTVLRRTEECVAAATTGWVR